jgi:SAM-dependent methyltransferase
VTTQNGDTAWRTMPITRCPACHSSHADVITIGSKELKKCRDCHLPYAPAYVDPSEIYVEGYHSGGCGRFGNDTTHPAWKEFLDYVGDRRMAFIQRIVTTPGRFVDVGCGAGHTVESAQRRGWDACGVELVPSAVQIAQDLGLHVMLSTLEESDLPQHSFDVVAASHVLEHQRDGVEFLSSISRWLKPGGYLFLEVPNWSSFDRRGNADRWQGLRPLEHLAHYSPRTLGSLMRRLGYQPVLTETPFYTMPGTSLGQMLNDYGLTRLVPLLSKRALTVPIQQHDEAMLGPNAFLQTALKGVGRLQSISKGGVVLNMMVRVP